MRKININITILASLDQEKTILETVQDTLKKLKMEGIIEQASITSQETEIPLKITI